MGACDAKIGVYLGVRTCELFLCFVVIVRVRVIMLTSLFSLFYVTREFHRFLHRGRAKNRGDAVGMNNAILMDYIKQFLAIEISVKVFRQAIWPFNVKS